MSGSTRASSPNSGDLCLEVYDQIIGIGLDEITIDGCLVKAPCGGEAAGKSPVDRGKQGTRRSLMVDAFGIPFGCVVAGANRNDSILLEPTLEHLARFDHGLPEHITVRLGTPATARTRPANDWPSWVARGASPPKALPCKPIPAGFSNVPTPGTTGAFANC